jgi:hypothetical protein
LQIHMNFDMNIHRQQTYEGAPRNPASPLRDFI